MIVRGIEDMTTRGSKDVILTNMNILTLTTGEDVKMMIRTTGAIIIMTLTDVTMEIEICFMEMNGETIFMIETTAIGRLIIKVDH